MTTLREQIETAAARSTTPSRSSPTSPTPSAGTPASPASVRDDPGPVGGRRALSASASGWAAASRRWTTRSRPSSRPRRVVLAGRGRGRRGRRRHPVRAADAGGTRIDYTADIRLVGLLRLAGPFAGGAFAGIARRRARRHAARARPAARRAPERRWTSRSSAPASAGSRPPTRCATTIGSPCSSATPSPAATSRPSPSTPPTAPVEVDTGFIVYNERTYPRFVGLLAELGVETQPSDMSFGSACRACGIAYSSRGARGFFPDAGTAARPVAVADARGRPPLLSRCPAVLDAPELGRATLGDWLDERGYGRAVPRPLPRPDHVRRLVHGGRPDPRLPGRLPPPLPRQPRPDRLRNAPQWRVVRGGSRPYVERDRRRAAGRPCAPAIRSSPVARDAVRRHGHARRAGRERFDAVVMATHADDALRLLVDADARERARPRRLRVLHATGRAPHRRARPAGEPAGPRPRGTSRRRTAGGRATPLTMTYHMNRLQSLAGPVEYCVVGQPGRRVSTRADHRRAVVQPPAVHVPDARRAGRASARSRASDRTWFAGAHLGYGFHEDGCRSGLRGGARMIRDADGRWRHEVAPARGQGPPPPRAAVHATSSSTTSTTSRSTSTSSTTSTDACGSFEPQPAGTWSSFRDRDHLARPAADLRAASATHLRAEGDRSRRAGGSRWSRTCGSSATSSTRRASTSAATARRRCGSCRRGPQHVRRAPPVHAPAARDATAAPFAAAMDKAFFVSPFIEMDGRYAVRVRDEPDGLRIAIDERQDGAPLLSTSLVLRRAR